MNYYHSTKWQAGKFHALLYTGALLILLAGILAGNSATAQPTNKQPTNFYAITGNGLTDTSWLFGTYHLVKSSYLEGFPAIMQAFHKSKGVAVELVLDSSKTAQAASMGLMKEKTLSELLDKPFQDSLNNELKTIMGIDLVQFNQLKPINVAITLSMVYLITDPNSPLHQYSGAMMDGYFANSGKKAHKKITEFETIEEQMNLLFNSSTNEEQVNQLKYFLRNKTAMIRQGNDLITAWLKHDLGEMYSISEKGLSVFGNENDFLNKRNDKWMQVMPGLMKKESQFIAVGALHLAGPHGLVNQLQDLGYTVTPIKL